jgi:hypothetical protein
MKKTENNKNKDFFNKNFFEKMKIIDEHLLDNSIQNSIIDLFPKDPKDFIYLIKVKDPGTDRQNTMMILKEEKVQDNINYVFTIDAVLRTTINQDKIHEPIRIIDNMEFPVKNIYIYLALMSKDYKIILYMQPEFYKKFKDKAGSKDIKSFFNSLELINPNLDKNFVIKDINELPTDLPEIAKKI